MRGGTYAEALKAGFTPEEAGFLGRMGGETKDEAVERVFEEISKRGKETINRLRTPMIFAGGVVVGAVVTRLIL